MHRVSRIVLAMCLGIGAARGVVSFAMQENTPQAQQEAVHLAASASDEWMGKLDAGKYEECWNAASELVKNAVTMEKFASSVKAVRDPMGRVESRKLKSASYTTSVPGVPSGEYVLILYDTSFEHKAAAQETVVMSRETDKVWRVAGYHIK